MDELRGHIISYLCQNRVCVIATNGSLGAWAVPATYISTGLELYCRLPRWSDVAYYLAQDPRVMIIIPDAHSERLCWLQYRGVAQVKTSIDDRFITIHTTPERIDLLDEGQGWGARETLDI